jgi:nickel/cobalt transporter (NicO) family protein
MLTFSPCEGFVPVYITGIDYGWLGFGVLTLALLVGSVGCMVLFTWLSMLGLQRIPLGAVRRYESGLLGVLLCLLGALQFVVE